MPPKNPYETTQGNFSGTGGVPNPYETTQGNFSGTGGVPNPYETTQGNFSGTGGFTPPLDGNVYATTQGAGGQGVPGGGGYVGPSWDDIQKLMQDTLGGYATTADVESMMSGTMGSGGGGGGYQGPSTADIQKMMETTLGNAGYMTAADVEAMMANTMGSAPPPVVAGPTTEDIQKMMESTLGGAGYATPADIEAMMQSTLGGLNLMTPADVEAMMQSTLGGGNYMTSADVEALMESTMGGIEPGSAAAKVVTGDTNVNVDLGGDTPGLSMAELSDLMESTLGTTPGNFVAGAETADMDADGDGRVSQAELEAYQGNVYQYDVPDEALTGVDPLNQMVLDYMGGTGTLPGIANFMDDLDIRHEQQDADFQQSLVNRGITDSTIADNMWRQHERNQANERAMLETNLMQNLVPLYTQTGTTYEGLLDQDRAQSLGEFFQFLDRQTAENRWTDQQQSQALSLMLNALGIGTINPQMPGFSIPAGQPGAGQSIATILGNLGTAYLGNPEADLSWLGL